MRLSFLYPFFVKNIDKYVDIKELAKLHLAKSLNYKQINIIIFFHKIFFL